MQGHFAEKGGRTKKGQGLVLLRKVWYTPHIRYTAKEVSHMENIRTDRVFTKDEPQKWICRKCGYVHEGESAPQVCPVCGHKQEHYELLSENY